MKNIDVVFYEVFTEEKKALESLLPSNLNAQFEEATIQESSHADLPAPLISIRTQSIIPPTWKKGLGGILTRSTGYNHVVKYINENAINIPCGYLPTYCERSVAEQAVLMMLALMRKLALQKDQFGVFERNDLTGVECYQKNTLIVGVGNIGKEIVQLTRGMGMNVRGVDVVRHMDDLEYVDFLPGLRWADIIICSASLTNLTHRMFNYKNFSQAKPGSFFINISRGEISPIEDLSRLIDEKILRGVALDVFDGEEELAFELRCRGSKLSEKANLYKKLMKKTEFLFTPHNAFNTKEALARKAKEAIDSALAYKKENVFLHPVPLDD